MDSLQQTVAVIVVLALLGATLFWLRRNGLAQFSLGASRIARGSSSRRLQLVERLPLSPQHSLQLVRVGDRELLIGISPGGCALLDQHPASPERNIAQ